MFCLVAGVLSLSLQEKFHLGWQGGKELNFRGRGIF